MKLPREYYRSNEEYLEYLNEPRTKDEIILWVNRGDQFAEDLYDLYMRVTHKLSYLKSINQIKMERKLIGVRYVRVYVRVKE